jgi:hypothetical protein
MKIHDDCVAINEALLVGYGWSEQALEEHARTTVPKANAKGTEIVPAYYTGTNGKVMYRFAAKQIRLDDNDGLEQIKATMANLGKDEQWAADAFVKGANLLLGAEVKPQPPAKRGGTRVDDSMAKFLAAIAAGNTNALALVAKVSTKEMSMQQAAAAFAAE